MTYGPVLTIVSVGFGVMATASGRAGPGRTSTCFHRLAPSDGEVPRAPDDVGVSARPQARASVEYFAHDGPDPKVVRGRVHAQLSAGHPSIAPDEHGVEDHDAWVKSRTIRMESRRPRGRPPGLSRRDGWLFFVEWGESLRGGAMLLARSPPYLMPNAEWHRA